MTIAILLDNLPNGDFLRPRFGQFRCGFDGKFLTFSPFEIHNWATIQGSDLNVLISKYPRCEIRTKNIKIQSSPSFPSNKLPVWPLSMNSINWNSRISSFEIMFNAKARQIDPSLAIQIYLTQITWSIWRERIELEPSNFYLRNWYSLQFWAKLIHSDCIQVFGSANDVVEKSHRVRNCIIGIQWKELWKLYPSFSGFAPDVALSHPEFIQSLD